MPYLSSRATDDLFFGEIDEAVRPWLHLVAVGGACGNQAIALPLPGPDGETPRELRARLLTQAEDAFDALAAAGLELARLPELEFKASGELVVWFSVQRAGATR